MTEQDTNRHQRRRLRTRAQLQDAMVALVLEKGFESIIVQEITDRADVGRGTFYFHFDSKEDILWSLIEDRIHLTEQEVMTQYGGQMPEQPEFIAFVNMFRHVQQHKDIYRAILGNNGSQEITNRVKKYMVVETLQDITQYNVYAGIGQPPEITAQIVIGLLTTLAIWWLETPNEYTSLQMGEILYRTLFHQEPPTGMWRVEEKEV